jgi:tetratricopeptide (TPR) repeat protein
MSPLIAPLLLWPLLALQVAFLLQRLPQLQGWDLLVPLALLLLIGVMLQRAHLGLGEWEATRGRYVWAVFHYRLVQGLTPWSKAPLLKVAHAWADAGQWARAEAIYQQVLTRYPENIEALNGLGFSQLLRGNYAASLAYFRQAYHARRGWAVNEAEPANHPLPWLSRQQRKYGVDVSVAKLEHDRDQFDYLAALDTLPQAHRHWLSRIRIGQDELLAQARNLQLPQWRLQIPVTGATALTFNHNLYLPELAWPEWPCLASDRRVQRQGKIWTVDQCLTPQALAEIQRFCLEGTHWHDDSRRAGYLASVVDDGFNAPVLYALARELKAAYPEVLGDYELVYLWAFKCDAQREAVALHADSAVINFNFWITPDRANRDPASGGMLIYPQAPPSDWNLEEQTLSESVIAAWVAQQPPPVRISYQCNRAVMFPSRLIHASDHCDFAAGYMQRRINITLLFGHKTLKIHPKRVITA